MCIAEQASFIAPESCEETLFDFECLAAVLFLTTRDTKRSCRRTQPVCYPHQDATHREGKSIMRPGLAPITGNSHLIL
jgi:hypothetical protein